MSTGQLTVRRCLSVVIVLALGVAVPASLTGCGGGDQEESATQQKPRALVSDAALDTVTVDTGVTSDTDSSYEAGTLPDAEGVIKDQAAGEQEALDAGSGIKAVPTETETGSVPSGTRPSTSVSSGDGAYGLQLGSFTSLANARRQADRISALGYAPVIEESDLGGQIYHRVMLWGVGDMAETSRLGEYIHSETGIAYLVRRGN